MITAPPVAGKVPAIVHPKVGELLARQQYEQRTPEWYDIRRGLMTASDAAGALGIPAYEGQTNVRTALLRQKVSGTFTGNHMTRWGQSNEDKVRERAMVALGEAAWDVGLVVHPTLSWLGASPDGVTSSGKLVEIKCPYKRVPDPNHVPHHYMPQIQVQLECTDLDQCYFVQWQPAFLSPDNTERFTITTVERDRAWFAQHVDQLKEFWKDLMQLRKTYVPPPPPECEIDLGLYALPVDAPISYADEPLTVARVTANRRQLVDISESDSDASDSGGDSDSSGGSGDMDLLFETVNTCLKDTCDAIRTLQRALKRHRQ